MTLLRYCVMCAQAIPDERILAELETCSDDCARVHFGEISECRFWEKVLKTDSCWEWTGGKDSYGYGQFQSFRQLYVAHRFAYGFLVGGIPPGMVIDHLCRNRACVNPLHLEAVTSKENTLRSFSLPALNSRKTVCHNGHPFDSSQKVRRACKTCNRDRMRLRRELKRLALA